MRYKNNAELEMERMQKLGDKIFAAKKLGICSHGWVQGTPGANGPVKCLDCGATWATDEDHYAANRAAMNDIKGRFH